MAAETHNNEGMTLSSSNDLKIKKQAAKEFKMALGFVLEYRDASQKYEKMRQAAILRMAIMPFETREEFLLAMIKAKPISASNIPGVSKAIIEAIAPNIPCALNPIIAANLTPVSPGNRKVIPNMLPNSAASITLYCSTNVS